MNALIQKLHDSKSDKEFAKASSDIFKSIEAAPAAMLLELEAAYQEAGEALNTAQEFFEFALSDLGKAETIENKAAAWDAYWEYRTADRIAHELYEHMNEADFHVQYPEEVERLKNEPVVVVEGDDPFPF